MIAWSRVSQRGGLGWLVDGICEGVGRTIFGEKLGDAGLAGLLGVPKSAGRGSAG